MTSTSLSFLELNCPTDVIQGDKDRLIDPHRNKASDWSDLIIMIWTKMNWYCYVEMVKDIQVIWEMVANMEIGFILKIVIFNEWNKWLAKIL